MGMPEPLLVCAQTDFDRMLELFDARPLMRQLPEVLQLNLGRLCNQSCRHCHADAGPDHSETMSRQVAHACLRFIARTACINALDLTGGSPELHPSFRLLVRGAHKLDCHVSTRTNLTVFFEAGQHDLARFFAQYQIEILASLPSYLEEPVDAQRGQGVFEKSIGALRLLNALGYGRTPRLRLNLLYNPQGIALPPNQELLEGEYRRELSARYGIVFHRLYAQTNMPVQRFERLLRQNGDYDRYVTKLVHAFNPATLEALMCRRLLSVGPDGRLYDCDFNQMLSLPLRLGGKPLNIRTVQLPELLCPVHTARHCFGCTAGAGCGHRGALV